MKVFSVANKNKMKVLLGTLIAFVILDGVQTEILLSRGVAREVNPFLQPLVGDIGFITWVAVVGYGIIVLWNTTLCFLL
jgi:hypothetical protein